MASSITDYLENQLVDHLFRAATFTKPTAIYVGLIVADKGDWAASTVYVSGDYVIPTTPNGRLYKCTTGGTSGGSEPTWPTTDGGTVNDNGVVWTEQSIDLDAGTIPEPSGGAYARVQYDPSDTNWDGTHGSTTGASSGTDGQTHNVSDITFPVPTADWGRIWGLFLTDAASGGNPWLWAANSQPKNVNNGDPAPKFPATSLTVTLGATVA